MIYLYTEKTKHNGVGWWYKEDDYVHAGKEIKHLDSMLEKEKRQGCLLVLSIAGSLFDSIMVMMEIGQYCNAIITHI